MIRFEDDRRHLALSVRDLADDGDYRFSGPAPLSLKRRALLGRLAHEDHQGAREDELTSYRRERGVRFETQVSGWTVLVTGRIDGIYSDADGGTVIEEVKTIVGSEAELAAATEETFPAYTRQLQLYRYLLEEGSKDLGFTGRAPEMALHLLLIALPSKADRVLELSYRREDCHALVHERLNQIISRRTIEQARSERRRALAEQIVFPHTPRPHQDRMAEAIAAGLEGPGRVLASAPPGIGKTAAALVPALRRAATLGGRVFVATSKTTQQAIFAKTVSLMREAGAPVRSVVLTARSKACLNDVVHCHPDACRYAAGYEGKLTGSGAVERLLALPVADAQALRDEAEAHEFCPVEAAFDLTADVDVIIGDYNYVFDPGAALKRMFVENDPSDVVLVIDEAHNLYPRGMSYYSPQLPRADLEDLARRLVGASAAVSRRTRDVLRRLLVHMRAIESGGVEPPAVEEEEPRSENMLLFEDPAAKKTERRQSGRTKRVRRSSGRLPSITEPAAPLPSPPLGSANDLPVEREVVLDAQVFQELRDELNELSVAWFAEGRGGSNRVPMDQDPLLVANRLLSRFVAVLELGGEEFSIICRRATPERGGALKILCKDPSQQLGRRIKACGGAVAVSATLEPLEFYRDVLGFGADAALHRFPSPFDASRRRVMVLDLPSTTYKQRERDLPIVEDAIRAVLAAHQGNYLICCPSFAYLERLHKRLDGLPNYELRCQRRSMTESHRAEVLDRMRLADAPLPLALLVVQGGIFTEGVDYPGQDCEGVIVVGPGLPAVNFERELIQAYYQEAYGRGFEYAFLYPGMSKVIQAAGRVIRTPTDTGVVVLVGSRFATDRYNALFPRDWYQRHPRELISLNPYEDLKQFWERARP